jgi:hypothetical protein
MSHRYHRLGNELVENFVSALKTERVRNHRYRTDRKQNGSTPGILLFLVTDRPSVDSTRAAAAKSCLHSRVPSFDLTGIFGLCILGISINRHLRL